MATTTTNFGWDIPQSTDLVKDGATAIAALGQDIDTAFVDLKGGTTGQVLAKASNTDLDYSWVAQDDSNAIQNSIVDAKGDLIGASAADTPARLAVGNNGETLIADSSTSTGLRWQGAISAGKNAIINGSFDNWQRGTSFSNAHGYNADRWLSTGATAVPVQVISRQSLTPGDIEVTGLPYFFRHNVTNVNGATGITNQHRIENVQTFAGQTVTLSFYAKADAARTVGITINQNFGSGGSADVAGATTNFNLTTSWVRYSMTVTLGSLSGKTIGTSSFLYISLAMPLSTFTIDYTAFQLELGSVPTSFSRAGGTIQGELAACQRYYETTYDIGTAAGTATETGSYGFCGAVNNSSATYLTYANVFKVTKRGTPTITLYDLSGNSGKVNKVSSVDLSMTANQTATADRIGQSEFRVYSLIGTCSGFYGHYVASAEL